MKMNLTPFEKVTNVPRGKHFPVSDAIRDVLGNHDLIEIISLFNIESVRSTILPKYRGMGAYVFDAHLYMGFNHSYKLMDLEFRLPFNFEGASGLFLNNLNLFQPTLMDVRKALEAMSIATELIDVGLEAPSIGVSFFSNEYENDLNVKLDSVTVHFTNP